VLTVDEPERHTSTTVIYVAGEFYARGTNMSHRNQRQNLSEWAELIGASLPDSVEDREDAGPTADAYVSENRRDGFGSEFGVDSERSP
jgi:hypothetical protein